MFSPAQCDLRSCFMTTSQLHGIKASKLTPTLFVNKSLFFRERDRERKRERERERETPSRLHAVSAEPDARLDPMNWEIMTSTEIKSGTLNQLSHPGAPAPTLFE